MLGPKSSSSVSSGYKSRPARLVAGSGGCSSSLKKPSSSVATSCSFAPTSVVSNGNGNSSRGSSRTQSSVTLRQGSQSSLSATATAAGTNHHFGLGGKSTSRSSITSDTTASVCSSSLSRGSAQQIKGRTGTGITSAASKSSAIPSTAATTKTATATTTTLKSGPPSCSSSSSASLSLLTGHHHHQPKSSSSSLASSSTARRVPTLAMSLRDKDQQIKLLIKERDEQKFQAELMAQRAEQWEEKFVQSELEKSHVTSEADDEVVELRRLAQELEDENRRLAERLASSEQVVSDTQFKLDEIEIESKELKQELIEKEEQLETMEQEQRELAEGKPVVQVTTERAISKLKYEREIEELKEKIMSRDEQMIQLRTSLEMRKNEVTNLQSVAGDLERKLKIESERSERHLKRIDEINLELKASEAKLSTKMEENEMYEKQVKQLRQELRQAEEKLEQISLARKKDVDILHNKLSAARRGSTTPTSPQPYKTPTPQDEIVRLQMEIRDLKDQLIDREAELDCNRRDMEVMKRKMETRTLEVDCNNQELARRCQDLLEQNRQSEETVKSLLKSTTEHSAQLMRATEDLKEANGKCIKLRDEINVLEEKLDEQLKKSTQLTRENSQLKDENEELREQVELLRQQVATLNCQLSDLCEQLDVQTDNLHKDREALANQLSQNEIDSAQMRHDLATAKQDLRTSKLQTQEVISERDRIKSDLEMKEKYIRSRNDIIETMRHELEDSKKSLNEQKSKIEQFRQSSGIEVEKSVKELKLQLDTLKREVQLKTDECVSLRLKCEQLQKRLQETKTNNEEEELKRFDEMRQKHSVELDSLKEKLKELEDQLEEAKSSTLKRDNSNKSRAEGGGGADSNDVQQGSQTTSNCSLEQEKGLTSSKDEVSFVVASSTNDERKQKKDDYETQIEFLNSLVVDMQRKCDDYKNRLAQVETMQIMSEFDNLILSNQSTLTRSSTLRRNNNNNGSSIISNSNSSTTSSSNGSSLLAPPAPVRATLLPAASATLGRPTNRHSVHFDSSTVFGGNNGGGLDNKPSRISGRPFCDICNVYDLHHTIYCPKVSEKLASRRQQQEFIDANFSNNNNNELPNVDQLFREYEQSIDNASHRQFSSLRRPQTVEKPPRPYCDHCDLFGHTIKSCNSLKVQ